jgi:molybdate transport system substrate-binding protein
MAARAISYSDPAAGGASGLYFAKLIERLDIADAVNAKTRFPPPAGLCAQFLTTGEVDLALQQKPELLQVPGIEIPGIEILGPLPGDLHMVTAFVAGVAVPSTQVAAGQALIDFLRSPEAAEILRAQGLDPA